VSRSPSEDATSEEIRAYDVGWAATNQLIRAGRSFSGRERNCVFLNLGDGGEFADISASSGLDFPDDGRGLALSDWDRDGRMDFWVMNRTGPRVRFLKNDLETANDFVSLRLYGENANVDGIGARVKILSKGEQDQSRAMVKTVRAGSGYLSQSSKWIHFGLGQSGIEAVEVEWPGGNKEVFLGVSPNGHFLLHQGKGKASRWEVSATSSKVFRGKTSQPTVPPEVPSRVILLNPAPIPSHLTFRNSKGEEESLFERFGDQPTVLHLWATWCENCESEMKAWGESAERLEGKGLKVLAICVDEPSDDRVADLARAQSKANELGFPFEVGLANGKLIENLNILQRSFIGRQTDFPLPSTLLIDRSGLACVIYKGPVSVEQLVRDAELCGVGQDEILAVAIPEPGRWKTQPKGLPPRMVAVKMISNGMLDDARSYLHQLMPLYEDLSTTIATNEYAECQRVLGAIAHEKGELEGAVSYYQKSLEVVPDQKPVLTELMHVFLRMNETGKAADQVEAMLAIDRNDFENLAQLGKLREKEGKVEEAISLYRESLAIRFHPETSVALANRLRDRGESAEAIEHYAAALESRPRDALAANNYAWLLATHPDEKLRNGAEAVVWSRKACEITGKKIPQLLGTLAAAHAELREFEKAVEISKEAITLARENEKQELAERLEVKMVYFEKRKPFRDVGLLPDVKEKE